MKRTYRQIINEDGKSHFIEVTNSTPSLKVGIKVTEPFVSPIDGSLIRNSADLASHNRRHGVTNDLDSIREKTERHRKRMEKPYTGSRKDRLDAIVKATTYLQHNPHLWSKQ